MKPSPNVLVHLCSADDWLLGQKRGELRPDSLGANGFVHLSTPEQVHLLTPGRVLDTTRLREQAGFTPAYTTVAAFDDFAARLRPAISPQNIRSLERRVGALAGIRTAAPEDVPVPHPGSRPRLVGIDGAAGAPKRPRRRQR